jgi:hypothetical protein
MTYCYKYAFIWLARVISYFIVAYVIVVLFSWALSWERFLFYNLDAWVGVLLLIAFSSDDGLSFFRNLLVSGYFFLLVYRALSWDLRRGNWKTYDLSDLRSPTMGKTVLRWMFPPLQK